MRDFGETFYQALTQSTDDFIYVNDCITGEFRYPKALVELFPLPGEVVKNPLLYWERIVHPDDWERFYRSNMDIVNNLTDKHSVEFRGKTRRGEYVWIRCRGRMMRDAEGRQLFFAGFMSLPGKENKVDPLTQLLNNTAFYDKIDHNIQLSEIEQMAVIMFDVDNFRQINEMYDRSFGDLILKNIGQLFQASLPDNASLYRLEKDKMGILMTNTDCEDVEALYNKIQGEMRKIRKWEGRRMEVEISAGCAIYPKDGNSSEELYRYTDYALQAAKKQGKKQLVFFSEDILLEKKHSLELLRKLKKCVKQQYQGFYLHYQPQVQPGTEKIKGVEALMRWKNPVGQVVSPGEFIPILEENGMIYDAGLWILRTAFREGKEWLREAPDFSISINVSALQFSEEAFLEDLYRIIEEEQFPSENLVIELTESFAIKNIEILQEKFNDMRKHKIRIALDDFGTGYSSLAALKNMPVDIVKIDRSFVKDILNNKFDATFINLVTEICHTVSIDVCLEGVERKEEYDFLKAVQLDSIQGFYFGRPMEKEAISKFLNV